MTLWRVKIVCTRSCQWAKWVIQPINYSRDHSFLALPRVNFNNPTTASKLCTRTNPITTIITLRLINLPGLDRTILILILRFISTRLHLIWTILPITIMVLRIFIRIALITWTGKPILTSIMASKICSDSTTNKVIGIKLANLMCQTITFNPEVFKAVLF